MTQHFFHGGQKGLTIGSLLLPPDQTGAQSLRETIDANGWDSPQRTDQVYVTTSLDAARIYAAGHPSGGAVYRVIPSEPFERDPDCVDSDLAFQCASARIVEVIKLRRKDRLRFERMCELEESKS